MALTAIHPGEHLSEELRTLGMSAAELARNIRVPTNRVTQILNGQRAITGDTALRLGHFFGTTPEFWLNLQNIYELRLAQQKAGNLIQALPVLKLPISSRRRKEKAQKPVRAIVSADFHAGPEFQRPQGRGASRGARRTR
jgi:addiction module HigA family antidote